jgi:hypothetical protein
LESERICFFRILEGICYLYIGMILLFLIYKPAYTKSPFIASLEMFLCETGSGASPPIPPTTAKLKNFQFSIFAVTKREIQ